MDDRDARIEAMKQRHERLEQQIREREREALIADYKSRKRRHWKQDYRRAAFSAIRQGDFSKRESELLRRLVLKDSIDLHDFDEVGIADPKRTIYTIRQKIKAQDGTKHFSITNNRKHDKSSCYYLDNKPKGK